MTAPRWLLRAVTKFGLELRTEQDRRNEMAIRIALEGVSAVERRANQNLLRAQAAEARADEAERQLVVISERLRCAMAILRGEIEIPDFLGAATERRVPRREPEQVAA